MRCRQCCCRRQAGLHARWQASIALSCIRRLCTVMVGSLEAIRYKREGGHASLHLLEQRKLPLETEWLEISGPKAAWTAIRDMTVRGAPAIGEPPPPLPLAPASETTSCRPFLLSCCFFPPSTTKPFAGSVFKRHHDGCLHCWQLPMRCAASGAQPPPSPLHCSHRGGAQPGS